MEISHFHLAFNTPPVFVAIKMEFNYRHQGGNDALHVGDGRGLEPDVGPVDLQDRLLQLVGRKLIILIHFRDLALEGDRMSNQLGDVDKAAILA